MSAVKNQMGLWAIEIDDIEYTFEKWGAEEATETLIMLSKLVGKPLGLLVSTVMGGDESLLAADKGEAISLAIEALTTSLDAKSAMALLKKLTSEKCYAAGAPIKFNRHYEDRLDHMFRVAYAALEVQYGNFFGAVLGFAKAKNFGKQSPKHSPGIQNLST